MKFTFLKFKKDKLPPLKSLRPQVFNGDFLWFVSLGLCLIIFIVNALVGFRFFYSLYFESYKKLGPTENFENLININKINNFIGKRNDFINKPISLPRDPSL
jgi:hypothetical protein